MLEDRRLEILPDESGRSRGDVQRAGPVRIDPRLRLRKAKGINAAVRPEVVQKPRPHAAHREVGDLVPPRPVLLARVVVGGPRLDALVHAAGRPAAEVVPGQPPLHHIDAAEVGPRMKVHHAPLVILRQRGGLLLEHLGGRQTPARQAAAGVVEGRKVGGERLPADRHFEPGNVVAQRRVRRVRLPHGAHDPHRVEPRRRLRQQSDRPNDSQGQQRRHQQGSAQAHRGAQAHRSPRPRPRRQTRDSPALVLYRSPAC